ncbi:DUF58 domain-containing protein [Paenibacillus hamazuiensis]|uniref:DUF58 domain-containing protein n=1 Tax=Paenibacillus hamazuiensis TaxID=2936508 RepID=UPI00200E2F81|nr:DUF58 domain-containing protein [Paenibacillus hamazuiensis]
MSIHWILFVAVVLVFLQGYFFRKYGQKKLTYERFFSTRSCYAGEEVEMVERIANRKLLPVPWLRLELLIHAGLQFQSQANLNIDSGTLFQNHRSLFSLMPYTQMTRRHKIVCLRRGCYRLSSATLTCGDVLGIYTTSEQIAVDAELLVFPKPAPLEEIGLPSHSWQGDFTVRRWIVDDPFMIAGVREYRFGDPMKGINWKATARSGKLQVHQHDFTADHRVMIYVNVEDHEKMWSQVNDEELIERGISYAAAIAHETIAQGIETGFGTNAYSIDAPKEPVRVEPENGSGQLTYLLETMARLVIARSIPFDAFLEEEAERFVTNADIVVVSAYVSEKMERAIARLRSNGNSVSILYTRESSVEQEGA